MRIFGGTAKSISMITVPIFIADCMLLALAPLETMAEAMLMAEDALSVVLSLYIEGKRPIPPPTPAQSGERTVFASALVAAKIGLYEAMREHAIGKADLARRLNCHLPQVDRLLDLTHASKLEQVETALAALGKRLAVEVLDAA